MSKYLNRFHASYSHTPENISPAAAQQEEEKQPAAASSSAVASAVINPAELIPRGEEQRPLSSSDKVANAYHAALPFFKEKRYQEAFAILDEERAPENHPLRAVIQSSQAVQLEAWVAYVHTLLDERNHPAAIIQCNAMLARNPDDKVAQEIKSGAHYQIGSDHYKHKRYNEANTHFDQVVSMPDQDKFHVLRSVTYLALGRYEEAITSSDNALKQNKSNPYARYSKAVALHNLGHYAEAAHSFNSIDTFKYHELVRKDWQRSVDTYNKQYNNNDRAIINKWQGRIASEAQSQGSSQTR